MRKTLLRTLSVVAVPVAVLLAIGCAKHAPGATKSEASAVAGDWSVWIHDAKVNAYHARLEAKGARVTATKVYEEDDAMTRRKKGDTEAWCTFDIAAGKITGTSAAGGAVTGNVHGDGQGITLQSDKGTFELRREPVR